MAAVAGHGPTKSRAAAVSVASNTLLIGLKLVAAALTGSIAILTEAVHSAIDLIASTVAFVSVRKADDPPDSTHPYGHAKVEDLAAAIEGMLLIVGAGIILYFATLRLIGTPTVERLGVGLVVMGVSLVADVAVSRYLYRCAAQTRSPALAADAAHLRADALTSAAVFVGLALVQITGWVKFDALVAILVSLTIVAAALRILTTSSRILIDEALPGDELRLVRAAIEQNTAPELIGFHQLRARGGEAGRYVDLHAQFRDDTPLVRAHEIAHELEDAIRGAVGEADVLIHIEPGSASKLGED